MRYVKHNDEAFPGLFPKYRRDIAGAGRSLSPYGKFATLRASPVSSRMCIPVFARSTM
jgi:hypothetical protein